MLSSSIHAVPKGRSFLDKKQYICEKLTGQRELVLIWKEPKQGSGLGSKLVKV